MTTPQLPRGVWFEESRNRWRVRLWRNKRVHLSYHATLDEALKAHAALFTVTRMTAKVVRRTPPATPASTLAGLVRRVKNNH